MSTVIDTLIYDRTAQDVINDTDKAYCAYTDLNRIEQACEYVASCLGVSITTKSWVASDLRYDSDMTRIKGNLTALRSALSRASTPSVPATIDFSSINQANTIEKLLYDIDDYFNNILRGCPRPTTRCGSKAFGNR